MENNENIELINSTETLIQSIGNSIVFTKNGKFSDGKSMVIGGCLHNILCDIKEVKTGLSLKKDKWSDVKSENILSDFNEVKKNLEKIFSFDETKSNRVIKNVDIAVKYHQN